VLARLLNEISDYSIPDGPKSHQRLIAGDYADLVVPLQLVMEGGVLSLFSMTTVFGTPVDITLSEIAIEAFLPADTATAEALRRLASAAYL